VIGLFQQQTTKGKTMSAFKAAAARFEAEHDTCSVRPAEGHIIEGAEYNTGSSNAYKTTSGREYVSLMCKCCGIVAEYNV